MKKLDWFSVLTVTGAVAAVIGVAWFVVWFYSSIFWLIEKLIDKI